MADSSTTARAVIIGGGVVRAADALANLRAGLAVPGKKPEVEIYSERCRAVVQPDAPLWDHDNERMRA